MAYQIFVEVDFLVNFHEAEMGADAICATMDKVFVTESGKRICREMFGVCERGERVL